MAHGMCDLLCCIEFGVWIEFWTPWAYRRYNNLGVSWVLMYCLATLSLSPGDDGNSGAMWCDFGWS